MISCQTKIQRVQRDNNIEVKDYIKYQDEVRVTSFNFDFIAYKIDGTTLNVYFPDPKSVSKSLGYVPTYEYTYFCLYIYMLIYMLIYVYIILYIQIRLRKI